MKKKSSLILLIVAVIGLITTVSYAFWTISFEQTSDNVVVTDCFRITYEEDQRSNISLERGYPITNNEGRNLTPYVFWMENICTSMASYQINMESMSTSTMPERVLKTMINDNDGVLLRTEVEPTVGVRAFKVEEGDLYPNEKRRVEVRIWMDESTTMDDTDAMNKTYVGKVTVVSTYNKESKKYTEDILNGTDPVLKDGLIPVTIDNDGKVYKADENTAWYNYSNQIWANAVILYPDNERKNPGKEYQVEEEIEEDDIESYFVWIPRYKYKIWNLGLHEGLTEVDYNQVHTIDVIFGTDTTGDTDTTCKTPNKSGESGTCSVGKYMTHPAFTSFDENDKITKGIWVGKFETGYKGAESTTEAEVNTIEKGYEKIQIKPNVYSWRGIQVANAYTYSFNYKREYDSHMMKNTEWGAVAYLQHSKYGSSTSVRINNNSAMITGYGAVNEPTCGYTGDNRECNRYESTAKGVDGTYTVNYFNTSSVVASTTGNISGVYDMSGGSWEYVMGVMLDSTNITMTKPCSGRNKNYNSGFDGSYCDLNQTESLSGAEPFPNDSRYYDTYAFANDDEHYNRRILGDATGEMGPFSTGTYGLQQRKIGSWYDNEAWHAYFTNPWFGRSNSFSSGSSAGVFDFARAHGSIYTDGSYRIVLTI